MNDRVLLVAIAAGFLIACGPATEPATSPPEFAKGGVRAPNRALSFRASFVNVPDHNLLDLTSTWTLEAWVFPRAAGNGIDQDIISKWNGVTDASHILQIDRTGVLRLVTNDGTTQTIVLTTMLLANDTWQHVAATFDHGAARLYIDGVLDRVVTGVLTPIASTQPLAFGREGNFAGGTIDGVIDEVRVWDVVRSARKITRFRAKRLPGRVAGLVGYWHFDEGSGQTTADATGHGLNAGLPVPWEYPDQRGCSVQHAARSDHDRAERHECGYDPLAKYCVRLLGGNPGISGNRPGGVQSDIPQAWQCPSGWLEVGGAG